MSQYILKVEEEGNNTILTVLQQSAGMILEYKEIKKVVADSYDEYHYQKEMIENEYDIKDFWII